MTSPRSRFRRWLALGAMAALIAFAVLVLARRQLVGAAVGAALELAGASKIRLEVSQASPWHVVLDDVRFQYRTRPIAAARVSMERPHWWMPSVGRVRVEGVRVPLHADGSDTDPLDWATYAGGRPRVGPALPAEEVSIDGTLVLKAAAIADREVEVKIDAHWREDGEWRGTVSARGDGLDLAGSGSFSPDAAAWRFDLSTLRADLSVWQDFIQRMVVLPGGRWDVGGVITADAQGVAGRDRLAARAAVRLREGRLVNAERKIEATGVEFDVLVTDFDRFRTDGGELQVAALRAGELPIRQLAVGFDFLSAGQVAVRRLEFHALGGTLAGAEPFNIFLDQRELEAVVLAKGLQLEEVLALAEKVPASARGRVDGRIPIRIDAHGVRFGTGWLALAEGTTADLQLKAAGLLTRGTDPRSAAFSVLQKVESGLLRLRVAELRLDIYPPNRPPGRSATLHLAGEPADPSVKAPITLDLNVNGPIERLINLGLDARVDFGQTR